MHAKTAANLGRQPHENQNTPIARDAQRLRCGRFGGWGNCLVSAAPKAEREVGSRVVGAVVYEGGMEGGMLMRIRPVQIRARTVKAKFRPSFEIVPTSLSLQLGAP